MGVVCGLAFCVGFVFGEFKAEAAAFAGPAFNPDVAFVEFDEFLGDGQAEAGSVLAGPGDFVNLNKAVENTFGFFAAQAGAVVLNGARVGEEAIVGAGAVVTEGQEIPPGHLAVGVPAKVVRKLTEDELSRLRHAADHYVERAKAFRARGE